MDIFTIIINIVKESGKSGVTVYDIYQKDDSNPYYSLSAMYRFTDNLLFENKLIRKRFGRFYKYFHPEIVGEIKEAEPISKLASNVKLKDVILRKIKVSDGITIKELKKHIINNWTFKSSSVDQTVRKLYVLNKLTRKRFGKFYKYYSNENKIQEKIKVEEAIKYNFEDTLKNEFDDICRVMRLAIHTANSSFDKLHNKLKLNQEIIDKANKYDTLKIALDIAV
jgi:hypothetical protein